MFVHSVPAIRGSFLTALLAVLALAPAAFAQDAAHPFEALLQGPAGHFMVTLFFPMHPVAHSLFGLLSSIFAIAAHDGREWDFNSYVPASRSVLLLLLPLLLLVAI